MSTPKTLTLHEFQTDLYRLAQRVEAVFHESLGLDVHHYRNPQALLHAYHRNDKSAYLAAAFPRIGLSFLHHLVLRAIAQTRDYPVSQPPLTLALHELNAYPPHQADYVFDAAFLKSAKDYLFQQDELKPLYRYLVLNPYTTFECYYRDGHHLVLNALSDWRIDQWEQMQDQLHATVEGFDERTLIEMQIREDEAHAPTPTPESVWLTHEATLPTPVPNQLLDHYRQRAQQYPERIQQRLTECHLQRQARIDHYLAALQQGDTFDPDDLSYLDRQAYQEALRQHVIEQERLARLERLMKP